MAASLGHEAVVCATGAAFREWVEERVRTGAGESLPRLISLDHDFKHDDPDDGVVIVR